MSHLPFSPTGDSVELNPSAGSDSSVIGGGSTILVSNPTSSLVFIKMGTSSVTAAATDTPVGAGLTLTIKRSPTDTYIAAYSAANLSGAGNGVYAQPGEGV